MARSLSHLNRTYRTYTARLDGEYVDIHGSQKARSELYASTSYAASQQFGERNRVFRDDGILYDSVRMRGGTNVVAYRPTKVDNVVQTDPFDILVYADQRMIEVKRFTSQN